MNRAELLKTTEVGEIPASWEVAQLGEMFDVQQGKALSPYARAGISPRPFLRTSNVLWGRLDLSLLDQMDFTFDEAERLSLVPDDLLVCEGGEIGRTAIWKGTIQGCFYQNHIHRLRAKQPDISPDFVMYWMQAAFLHLRLYGGVGNRTTIPNLSGARLKSLPIPLPPVPEQRIIAAVLSKIQAAVEVQDKIVATLKELKAATMAKLFREGLRGEPLKQTEIGEIPKSWEVARLDAIADLVSGGTPSKTRPEWWQGPIPWASPKDMKQSRLWDTQDHISADALESGSRLVPAKTLFIVIRGMILAKDVPVAMTQVPMAFNQDMKAVLPRSTVDAEYLLYAISSQKKALTLEIGTSAHGTRRVGTSSLEALLVPLPSKEEQLEIATTLGVFEQRETVASRLQTTLKTFFSSMLHVLMTGQVRVTPKLIWLQRVADRERQRKAYTGTVDEKLLKEIVRRIVEAVAPEKIILFGSAARGEMGPDSDLDLLIVKSNVHRLATAQVIEHSLIGITLPTDIVVATPKDIEVHKNTIGLIYRPILREGKILYAA